MRYVSTRNSKNEKTFSQAVLAGLAEDGGLFLPESFPDPLNVSDFLDLTYPEMAEKILAVFLTDFTPEEIHTCVTNAYDSKFDTQEIVPLSHLKDGSLMELYHGPTSAFKDLALSILPQLLKVAYQKENLHDTISILTATSGDTGKAAIAGFADVKDTAITVFYPSIGVSAIQKKQMQTSKGDNVSVIAVEGNFDDCQRLIKEAVSNPQVKDACHGVRISSANSINIGRLLPQIVYYFKSYCDMVRTGWIGCGDEISFVVPTGNFGDILAGYFAKQIGLPVRHLICASNSNHVLTDFLKTGVYDTNRDFLPTMSPSMDILVSSNLERMLYLFAGRNDQDVVRWMNDLKTTGRFQVSEEILHHIQETFLADWCTEEDCARTIKDVYDNEHVVLDPHTAVAWYAMKQYQAAGNTIDCVVLSTASPYKFAEDVVLSLTGTPSTDAFAAMDQLFACSAVPIPPGLAALKDLPVRFNETISVADGIHRIAARMKELSHD